MTWFYGDFDRLRAGANEAFHSLRFMMPIFVTQATRHGAGVSMVGDPYAVASMQAFEDWAANNGR